MLFDEVDPVRRRLARGFRCKRYREFEAPRSRFAENEKMLARLRRKRGPYFFDGALLSENMLLLGRLDHCRRFGFFRTGAISDAGNICQTICEPAGHERYHVGL